jgi:hypothetical protein
MGQIKTGKFISTGAAINHNIGFVPAYAKYQNHNAAADEVAVIEYWNQMGDSKDVWYYNANAGGAVGQIILPHASGGYLTEYDSVSVGNQKSVTFDASGGAASNLITCSTASDVPANGDVLKFVDGGDIAAGLNELSNYYVIDSETYGAGTFRVSTTSPQKGAQSAVDLSDDGSGSNYFINVSNPLEADVVGGKGLTISASFSDDGDVISYVAIEADRDEDLGDSANW